MSAEVPMLTSRAQTGPAEGDRMDIDSLRSSTPIRAGLVAALLIVSWGAVHLAGGTRTALPHLFYVPIVVAGSWFGARWALLTALAAGVLCGPLTPLDVSDGMAQPTQNWVTRMVFFLAVAMLVAAMTRRLRVAAGREQSIAAEHEQLAQARSHLLQIVAHEIRTPLTIIKGTVATLRRYEVLGERTGELVPAAERAVDRLEDLSTIVVAAVEADTGGELALRTLDVSQLLRQTIGSLARRYDAGRVVMQEPADELPIETEPHCARLALRCLIENALKFSEPHARVDVAMRRHHGGVLIEVCDTGPGIPDAFTARDIQPWIQGDDSTTRDHGGVGLGIYTARRLVERLDGQLHLSRREGGGTRAALFLPAAPGRGDR